MNARRVLECGSPLPLSVAAHFCQRVQSARGLAQSKTWRQCVAILVFAALPLVSTFAQSYSIDWFTIDGGGGTSTGGVYSVRGTIGQPDAGPTMSGGNFTVDGGFWGLIAAVQTPGAPLLSIARTTTNTVAVSWPSPSTGFALQFNPDAGSPAGWVNHAGAISDDGTMRSVLYPINAAPRFFRLRSP